MKTSFKPVALPGVDAAVLTALSQEWREPSWVLDLRLEALKNFNALPMPTDKDEKWRRAQLEKLKWNEIQLSGVFATGSTAEIPDDVREHGVLWISLEDALRTESDRIRNAWSSAIQKAKESKFLSLTLALANGGGCFIIPKGVSVKAALNIPLKWTDISGARFPLNFVFLEEAAEAHIWEELSGAQSNTSVPFVSSYTAIELKENAKASCYYLQHWDDEAWHFQFQDIKQFAFSRYNAVAVSIGGRVFHNETTIHLQGQGAENKVLGVNFGDTQQNFENWITQNHRAIKTTSDIQYRGALKGSSHSFFSGLVSISKEAQQSDAFQSAKSLILSKDARADAIPNLEILADDVKCSHGAAVGPVDEDQKYYLQTRGISPSAAEEIIIEGFFEPVIAEVPSPIVQERLRTFIEEKLKR